MSVVQENWGLLVLESYRHKFTTDDSKILMQYAEEYFDATSTKWGMDIIQTLPRRLVLFTKIRGTKVPDSRFMEPSYSLYVSIRHEFSNIEQFEKERKRVIKTIDTLYQLSNWLNID